MRKILMLAGTCALIAICAACAPESTTTPEDDAVDTAADTQPAAPAPAPARPAPQPSPPSTTTPPASTTPAPATTPPAGSTPAPTPTASGPTMVEVPAGTVLELETLRNLSTVDNQAGDKFGARVLFPVTMGGQVAIPEGSIIQGEVTQAVSASKMKGQAMLTVNFHTLILPDKQRVPLSAVLTEAGEKVGKRTAGIVGGTAAGAALLGRIVGKDTKSAVKGALIGAAAGTAIAAAQDGQELKLPKGTGIAIELSAPVSVPVSAGS